jgi:hypothetical protein
LVSWLTASIACGEPFFNVIVPLLKLALVFNVFDRVDHFVISGKRFHTNTGR